MEFLKNNFDIDTDVELDDINEQLTSNVDKQKIESIMAQINAKLEKLPPEERKRYLQSLKDKVDLAILKKEKTLFEDHEEEIIDFDVSSLEPIDFDEPHRR